MTPVKTYLFTNWSLGAINDPIYGNSALVRNKDEQLTTCIRFISLHNHYLAFLVATKGDEINVLVTFDLAQNCIKKICVHRVLTIRSESWILSKKEGRKGKLVFEDKVLGKIFGPTLEDGILRIKH